MIIAYLVVAHKNPQLLKKEIKVLSCEDCAFFIHIDQKSNIEEFAGISGENIHFAKKRMPVYWGGFSQVEALLLLLRQALERPREFDYFVHLHGSDYPLRDSGYIHAFLEENRGLEFISTVKMPNTPAGQPISKINRRWIQPDKPVRRFIVRVSGKFGLSQRDYRKYLGTLEPYSGSAWWALTRDACQYILQFLESNSHVEAYFRTAPAPDEMLFHTILGNSRFGSRIRRSFLYEDWAAGGGHAGMISEHHVALFEMQDSVRLSDVWGSGEALFARKFSDERLDLIQLIDDMILRKKCPRSLGSPAARH
jgi:hypothetical protein